MSDTAAPQPPPAGDRRALLEARLRKARASIAPAAAAPAIPRRDPDAPCRLSFAQEQLWYLYQFLRGTSAYSIGKVMRLRGAVDPAVLQRAINDLVRRAEALRTTFAEHGGEPVQVVHADLPCVLAQADFSGCPEGTRGQEALEFVTLESRRPFDLVDGPLVRFLLVRLGDTEHLLGLFIHHIISDGWSLGLMLRELAALYCHHDTGTSHGLAEPSLHYADYAAWQRAHAGSREFADDLEFWRRTLEGAPASIDLPLDQPRPAMQSFAGTTLTAVLDPAVAAGAAALARQAEASPFVVHLAAWVAYLHRLCGQDDIVVGAPHAARTRPEFEAIVGYFANMIVLRNDTAGEPTFAELVRRVKESCAEAFGHPALPFSKLVEHLHPARNPAHNPIFQVGFSLEGEEADDRLAIPGLESEVVHLERDSSIFDLTLTVFTRGGATRLELEYCTALFARETASAMLEQFQTLLAAAVSSPQTSIDRLPLLTPAARERILHDWSGRRAEFPVGRCLHEYFEDNVARTPDAIALRHRDRTLTFRALNRSANHLAAALRERGIGPEKPVGIFIERSCEMIIALLAILKAGGAYLPIDTALPAERIAFMLEDSGTPIVLTQRRLLPRVPHFAGEPLAIEELLDTLRPLDPDLDENHPAGTTPASLAYIIYTSGSTGRPKGVLIEHGSAVNYTFASILLFGMRRADRVLQFASISFDASCEEIFVSLTVGCTLVLRTEEMITNATSFLGACHAWGITFLDLPTAYWHDLVTQLHARPEPWPSSVRIVVIGGERAQPEKLELWQQLIPTTVRLVNSYGPTETTVAATGADIAELPHPGRRVALPIGRPIANLTTYILDRHLQPVPPGVPGELLIGGAGLARGYLHRDDLTAEKFIPHPFDPTPGARLYRTGDLARFRTDGEIECLGRIDDQVKVRGFRIELGEIESALGAHPDVTQAAVIVHSTAGDNVELVAFLVLRAGASLAPAALRDHLRHLLPVYMIPAAYAAVPALPLNASGKVDRRALLQLERTELRHHGAQIAPRTTTESALAALWQEILGHDRFGVTDGFFDIGGHSLLAMRLVTEIQIRFERPLSLARLVAAPTIEKIAAEISDEDASAPASHRLALRGTGTGTPLFFMPGVGGFEFLPARVTEILAGRHRYLDTLQMPGADGTRPPLERVEDIAADLVQQVLSAHPTGPCAIAGFCYGGVVAQEVARRLQEAGREVRALIIWHGYPHGTWPRRSVPAAIAALFRHLRHLPPAGRRALLREKAHFIVDQLRRRLPRLRRGEFTPVRQEIPGIDFLPPDVDRRMVQANFRAGETFHPLPYAGRTFHILGETERTFFACPPLAGWDGLLTGRLEMFQIHVEHLELIKPPHVELLAAQTLACLQAAEEDAPAAAAPGVELFPRDRPA